MSTGLKIRPRRRAGGNTDPARAFGSEEQLMAEFQRQEYTQPAPKPQSVLSGIRERLAGLAARPHQTDAPVYSADTYAQETAPDLGWEAAFDPQAAEARRVQGQAAAPEGAPSAEERFEAFRRSVYSSPVRPRAEFTELYGAPARESAPRTAPVYEEISFAPRASRESSYQKPVYEEISFGPREVPAAAPEPGSAGEARVYYDENGVPIDPTAPTYGAASAPVGPAVSDGQYLFWSGSILLGVVLTLFSFIYACVV